MTDDLFDNATSEYLQMDELDGRLLLIWALDIRRDLVAKSGGKYDAIMARYAVLDGPVTEKIPSVPHTVTDGQFSAGQLVLKLRTRINGKPLLGRIDSRPSSFNKLVPAYGFQEPTEADKVIARTYIADNPPVDPFS